MPAKEEWRNIPGFGGWYQISTEGRVRSFRKGHGEKEVIDAFPSARQAALALGISPVTLRDYCNRKVKRSIFAPDGFIYCWDDNRSIWATLRSAMRELDELGLRYNNLYTGRYFDLPPDDGLDININVLW